ncbi:hypothetical protein [Paenibacillus sp. Cedars]|uniref:hypothetical protein n=1 Tax=Paenibacillus sp. Cedars TaxID=1980674 RepID=UPI0011623160|nr:hypothetical protein [Paenibacillus sp. Cedars]AWP28245.1 hypothetical protein B9D94_17220 [Paenibacillus sp. Cedars]
MAVLRDLHEEGTRVEYRFISRIPGENEGCQIHFKFFKADHLIYDLNFGWTNLTIRNYIRVKTEFPLDRLNSFSLNGLFMSFEKHLYQLDWKETDTAGSYQLGFYGSEQDFNLTADIESVRRFGSEFKLDWDQAPLTTE